MSRNVTANLPFLSRLLVPVPFLKVNATVTVLSWLQTFSTSHTNTAQGSELFWKTMKRKEVEFWFEFKVYHKTHW